MDKKIAEIVEAVRSLIQPAGRVPFVSNTALKAGEVAEFRLPSGTTHFSMKARDETVAWRFAYNERNAVTDGSYYTVPEGAPFYESGLDLAYPVVIYLYCASATVIECAGWKRS